MKKRHLIGAFLMLLASTLVSTSAFAQSANFTGDYIEIDAKTSDGKLGLKVHYDLNVRGCYGHTIQIGLVITTEDGKYLVDSQGNKGLGFTTQEIHYDNANLSDRSFTVPYSKIKLSPGKNTYYYQLYVVDKITGDYLGESDLSAFDLTGPSNSNNNSGSSNKNNNAPQRSASFSDLRVTPGTNINGDLVFYYDVTLKQCNSRKVKIQLTFKDSSGNYLYGKNNKKLIWTKTIDVKSNNIKYTDQSFTITISQLNAPSGGKSYYYQFAAYDDKTGDFLGQSEKKEQYLGNSVAFSNERVTFDEYDNGKPVISYYAHLNFLLPEMHDMKLVCALETDKNGKRHHYPDGREMIQEYNWKNTNKWTTGYIDVVMGFDHDEINPLPGKNTYWIRIYVYDLVTGKLINQSKAFAFEAEDEGATKSSSSSRSTQKSSSSSSSSSSSGHRMSSQMSSSIDTPSPAQSSSSNKKTFKVNRSN